ncbi:crossover junction endodeoxyribonuclease RuvC [Verrucomicrobia bacterium]|nr:crossover junction endodeoxyribonuclease RuvC [Verrucomicrobiota bacterium]
MGFTSKQLADMQQRLTDASEPTSASIKFKGPQIILGIDPSLRGTGYGVIDTSKQTPRTLAQGTIKCPSDWSMSRCFLEISNTIESVINDTTPTVAAIEGLFFAQNIKTALVMGQARGAALTTITKAGLDSFEIAPRKVKQAIVGFGGAQKEAVAKMVQTRLGLSTIPSPDAADALAIALAFSQSTSSPIPDSAIKPL